MQAWENFLKVQENELGVESVQKWLRPLKVIRFDACNLYLEAKDAFQVLWFEEHIRPKVNTRLLNNNNKRIKVHIAVANSPTKPAKVKPTQNKTAQEKAPALPKFHLAFNSLDPHCTFEYFFPCEQNQLPITLLKNISKTGNLDGDPAKLADFNPIYLHGSHGSGKTHLLMATAHALRNLGMHVIYAPAETFTEHVVTAIRAGEMSVFRQAYRNIDALIIDDVHVFSKKGATQEEFFHTFNTLHLSGKQIILSASCAPQELQQIEPRLVSRFEWGIVLSLEPPQNSDIVQILQKKAEALQFKLHPKLAEFLALSFRSGIKSMIRALKALILRSHLQAQQSAGPALILGVHQAKLILADLLKEEERMALTPERIIQQVAEYAGIRPDDVQGKAQSRECVLPRQMAMYFCRVELKMPYTKIAELFDKDHSTVMSSVKLIQKAIDTDERDVTATIDALRKKIHSPASSA